jgi:hypothetical protein
MCIDMLITDREHLYRRHLLPPQCHRCCTSFSNDVALREHQRDARGCNVREQVPPEGFDKEQERRLKSKKKSQTYQTEEEKWKSVYRILFPDDGEADIPTPYIEYQPCTGQTAEPSNVVRFQEFSRLELPRLVRRTLEAVVEQEAQPLEGKLKERLVDIVKECQNQLLSMFQTVSGSSGETAILVSDAAPAELAVGPSIADTSVLASDYNAGNAFVGFDTLPAHRAAAFQATMPLLQATVTMPKLPASSNSSDSGYDSTWPGPHALDTSAMTDPIDHSFPADYGQHEFVNVGGYLPLFGNHEESAQQSSSAMMSTDSCSWSFIEPIAGTSDLCTAATNQHEQLEHDWHL